MSGTQTMDTAGNVIRPPEGWWRRRHHHHHHDGDFGPDFVEAVADRVADALDLTPVQMEAWHRVTGLLAANGAALERLREDLLVLEGDGPLPVRLARLEGAMVAGLDVARQVRPALELFYGSLSDDQKHRLDALVARRRRRRRH